MGGNVTGITKSGKETRAQKIPLKQIGRKVFVSKIQELLKQINKDFEKKYKTKLWRDEKQIANGFIFNGSTSFIMNQEYSDEEIVKYKPSCGDLDIAVPEYEKENLWTYLDENEEKEIVKGVTYMGSNKPTISSIGNQINGIFLIEFEIEKKIEKIACQVDFEFLPFSETGIPSEWAKFSHSSSFDDCKAGIKAVHHKYILRAFVGGNSIREDILVATPKSTWDKVTISKNKKYESPKTLSFSVDKGVRNVFEPMVDPKGNFIFIDGKQVFKEIPTKESTYITDVWQIFLMMMNPKDIEQAKKDEDIKKMWTFVGVLELLKKYCNSEQIERAHLRYLNLLWGLKGLKGQELERDNPELDYKVKIGGYLKFIETFGLKDCSEEMCLPYYDQYGKGGKEQEMSESISKLSFSEYLAVKNYFQEYY